MLMNLLLRGWRALRGTAPEGQNAALWQPR
jgi:hypothetical protein